MSQHTGPAQLRGYERDLLYPKLPADSPFMALCSDMGPTMVLPTSGGACLARFEACYGAMPKSGHPRGAPTSSTTALSLRFNCACGKGCGSLSVGA
jgi:hypothetical protein